MNSTEIIGTSIKIDNLEIAEFDFPNEMTWDEGVKACIELGEGWRLPTKDELNVMYKNKNRIGGFEKFSYWSSTEHVSFAWAQYFVNGFQNDYIKNDPYYVRAVRTIK